MQIIELLSMKWVGIQRPVLIVDDVEIFFDEIASRPNEHLNEIKAGDVVALIGDFNAQTISDLLHLIDRRAILVPLSELTRQEHEYFFESAMVKWVIEDRIVTEFFPTTTSELIYSLQGKGHSGLVLFSSGTTGRPKAILHDFNLFLARFSTPRPTLKTLAFLLFDHIGGINTLLHTMFNSGTVICTKNREPENVLRLCAKHKIEVLPTTPTFLRLLLMSGAIPSEIPNTLKIITYGTERMDQGTLEVISQLLPEIDFRQTFGMSELGILRVKSKARDSLFMKIGGEGVEWKVENELLLIRSKSRMLGYLNAPSPFDSEDWYQTNDRVEIDGEFLKIIGRNDDVVNVGGLKFLLSEIERVAYDNPEIVLAKAMAKSNPITGQHVEMTIQLKESSPSNVEVLKKYFDEKLPAHMRPRKLTLTSVNIGHRYKML
jgi:acyl-coenzyme A synthetase/AMP-(fatty) acid ligase